MKAMVTGGAGFIGSHLCESLKKKNYDIVVIDNLFRGKYENVAPFIGQQDCFINMDLGMDNVEKLKRILLTHLPDVIFHYAAINGTQYFYDIPYQVFDKNIQATQCLAYAVDSILKEKHLSWRPLFVYASSSEVYNEPISLPTKESDLTYLNIESARDSYSSSKLFGEFQLKLLCEQHKLPWLICRLFNVYGPRMIGTKYGQVIPEFIGRLKEGEYPLSIIGSGEQTRSFCYVTDTIDLTLCLLENQVKNQVINIGNPDEIKIRDLADVIMEEMGLVPCYTYLPERQYDHKRRCPDIQKIRMYLPKDYTFISLKKGIHNLID